MEPLTDQQARALQPGDFVYWNDPDGCSRWFEIASISFPFDNAVSIEEADGSLLETYPRELSYFDDNACCHDACGLHVEHDGACRRK